MNRYGVKRPKKEKGDTHEDMDAKRRAAWDLIDQLETARGSQQMHRRAKYARKSGKDFTPDFPMRGTPFKRANA